MEHSATKQLWPSKRRHYAFLLLELGGKGRIGGVHSADVIEVGLPYSSLLSGGFLCVICAPFVLGPHDTLLHHFTLTFPT